MTRFLLSAGSGWGKSWKAQEVAERNAPGGGVGDPEHTADHLLVLDYKDEFRGLVSGAHGPRLARYWKAGRKERENFGPEHYAEMLETNTSLVLARHESMDPVGWREVCADAINAARRLEGDVVVVVDEAHTVAPQRGAFPEAIKYLATTGRGEGASSVWVTQRLTELEETVIAQADARLLGGYNSGNDLGKAAGTIEYDEDAHKAGGHPVPTLPEELHAPDAGAVSVRTFEDDAEHTLGSEWIYSDNSGRLARVNTREQSMETTHLGSQGYNIDVGL